MLLWATLVHLNPTGLSDFMVNEKVVTVMLVLIAIDCDDRDCWTSIRGIVFYIMLVKYFSQR